MMMKLSTLYFVKGGLNVTCTGVISCLGGRKFGLILDKLSLGSEVRLVGFCCVTKLLKPSMAKPAPKFVGDK